MMCTTRDSKLTIVFDFHQNANPKTFIDAFRRTITYDSNNLILDSRAVSAGSRVLGLSIRVFTIVGQENHSQFA